MYIFFSCTFKKTNINNQVGTGKSSICPPVAAGENPNGCVVDPGHEYLLTLEYYPKEVAALVQELDLETPGYHLFGHSWGTIVAIQFAATAPPGLRSLVLGGGLANAKTYIEAQWDEEEGNLGTLPQAMQDNIKKFEEADDFTNPVSSPSLPLPARPPQEYLAIAEMLTAQFTVRTFPAPDCVQYCGTVVNNDVYVKMQVLEVFLDVITIYFSVHRVPVSSRSVTQ